MRRVICDTVTPSLKTINGFSLIAGNFVFGLPLAAVAQETKQQSVNHLEYCYRVHGPYEPERGLVFDGSRYCLDPYGLAVTGQSDWCVRRERNDYRSRVVWTNFDWQDTRLPESRMEDLVIYELHGI